MNTHDAAATPDMAASDVDPGAPEDHIDPGSPPLYGRPCAAEYNIVFLARRGVSLVAMVDSVEQGVYHVSPPIDDDTHAWFHWDTQRTWTVDARAETTADNDTWTNAPLQECCVCMNALADRYLYCRCRAPCVCWRCASTLDKCPLCDARAYGRYKSVCSNIASIGARPSEPSMPITIANNKGRRMNLLVCPSWTVRATERILEMKTGIPPKQMRLIFGGRTLADEHTLAEYGVVHGSVVHQVLALRGD